MFVIYMRGSLDEVSQRPFPSKIYQPGLPPLWPSLIVSNIYGSIYCSLMSLSEYRAETSGSVNSICQAFSRGRMKEQSAMLTNLLCCLTANSICSFVLSASTAALLLLLLLLASRARLHIACQHVLNGILHERNILSVACQVS